MKIEIDYNGAFAVCQIEQMDKRGKMVAFNDADRTSQTFALSAMRTVKEHWEREQKLARYKNLPVMHIRREIQVRFDNLNELHELFRVGVIMELTFRYTTIHLTLNDGQTTVETFGWLVQDTKGHWWGMDEDYHRMLAEYQKIKLEE